MEKELHKDICEDHIFKSIYTKYAEELQHYVYYKYGASCAPKDKVQEAFIKLWENCKKIIPGSARAFLYKVANNMVLNDLKHQKVVLKYQLEKPKNYTNESPDFLLEKEEYFKKYQKALSLLSEEQRVAFMLNKVEGKKHEEIAQILGVTRKVVEYRIYSAFALLKKELDSFFIK